MIAFLCLVGLVIVVAGAYVLGFRRARSVREASPRGSTPVAPLALETAAAPGPASHALASDDDAARRIDVEKARIIRSRDTEAAVLRQLLADRDADLTTGKEADEERWQLQRGIADARAETARYRQLVIDIETNAPPPILSGAAGPDDLKSIVGIGPVLERMLYNLGIMSFQQIAHWSEGDIAEFDARLHEFPGRIERDQWVTQARALHRAKYGDAPDARRS